jgi:hypothetical protein
MNEQIYIVSPSYPSTITEMKLLLAAENIDFSEKTDAEIVEMIQEHVKKKLVEVFFIPIQNYKSRLALQAANEEINTIKTVLETHITVSITQNSN